MAEQNAFNEEEVEWTDEEHIEEQIKPYDWNGSNTRQNNSSNVSRDDHWNNFMFGPRSFPEQEMQEEQNPNQIDYAELMYNIDTLVASVKSLKPLFQKVYPYVQQLWVKK